MTALTSRTTWLRYATCRTDNHDPELWFSDRADQLAEAQRLCATCPVRPACLEDVLTAEGSTAASCRWGIVAGLTGEERRAEYERRQEAAGQTPRKGLQGGARHRAVCGTEAARRRHRRNGEVCPRCNTPRPEPQPTAANRRRTAA